MFAQKPANLASPRAGRKAVCALGIEQSDGVTAISNYLKKRTLDEFEINNPIEVIPNFVNCDLYCRSTTPEERAQWAPGCEPILMHLSNFRPVKCLTERRPCLPAAGWYSVAS